MATAPCAELLKQKHAKKFRKFAKDNPSYDLKFDELEGIPFLYYELPDKTRILFCMTFHQNVLDSYITYSSFSVAAEDVETDEDDEEATDPYMQEEFELSDLVDSVFKEIKKSRAKVLPIKRVK